MSTRILSIVVLLLACPSRTGRPKFAASPAAPDITQAGTLVYQVGQHLPSAIKCGSELVWMAKSGPGTRDTELWAAKLPDRREEPLDARKLLVLQNGGSLQYLRTAGAWAVFTDFKQHGSDPWADWWKLTLVNLRTGDTRTLATATVEPMTKQPPRATISEDAVAWDERTPDGGAILRLYSLKTENIRTLHLPTGVHPTQPFLSGKRVVFLDASTDHLLGSGIWFFLGGRVSTFDLDSGLFAHVKPSPPLVRQMSVEGHRFSWVSSARDPRHATGSVSQLELGYVDGRPGETIGYGDGGLSGDYLVRNDSVTETFVVSSLKNGKTLMVLKGRAKFHAVCDDRLYFAVSRNDTEGAIRVLQL